MLVCKLQISSSLLVLQNKVLRVEAGGIEFLNWVGNVTQYYTKINVLKLDDLYKFEIIKLMHQLVTNKLPPPFSFFTHIQVIRVQTRRLALMEHGLYQGYKFNQFLLDFGFRVQPILTSPSSLIWFFRLEVQLKYQVFQVQADKNTKFTYWLNRSFFCLHAVFVGHHCIYKWMTILIYLAWSTKNIFYQQFFNLWM